MITFGAVLSLGQDRLDSFSAWKDKTPSYIGTGFSNSVSNPTNQIILGGTAMGALFSLRYDQKINDYSQSKNILPENVSHFGDKYGGRWAHWILWVTVLGSSWVEKEDGRTVFRKMEFASTAIATNLAVTYLLKFSVGRERPNGKNRRSFPSGHTSNSFAVAAIAHELFGDSVGTVAYLTAVLVGVSRINDNQHYLSDVLFGAGIGTTIGRGFAAQYRDESNNTLTQNPGITLKIILPIE